MLKNRVSHEVLPVGLRQIEDLRRAQLGQSSDRRTQKSKNSRLKCRHLPQKDLQRIILQCILRKPQDEDQNVRRRRQDGRFVLTDLIIIKIAYISLAIIF